MRPYVTEGPAADGSDVILIKSLPKVPNRCAVGRAGNLPLTNTSVSALGMFCDIKVHAGIKVGKVPPLP